MNIEHYNSITEHFNNLTKSASGPLKSNTDDIVLALSASSTQEYFSALKRISCNIHHSPFPAVCQYMQSVVQKIKKGRLIPPWQPLDNPNVLDALYNAKAVDSAIMFEYLVFTEQRQNLLALITFTTNRLQFFAFPSDFIGLSQPMITFITERNLKIHRQSFSNTLANALINTSQLSLYEDVLTAVIAFDHSLAFDVLILRKSKGLHIPPSLFDKLLEEKTPFEYLQTSGLTSEQKGLVMWLQADPKQPDPMA
ncbi:hypothetical protein WE348_08855 [Alteromonas macleodii]|uniref:hypothetical protein n=1 Tax=Alteromonas macleodii TaxID=28108 RepID=UPI0030D25272